MRETALRVVPFPAEIAGQEEKRSRHPTQPGSRSNASRAHHSKKKHKTILHRAARFFKMRHRLIFLLAAVSALIFLPAHQIHNAMTGTADTPETVEAAETEVNVVTVYFVDGDGQPVDMEAMTAAWAAEAGLTQRYILTDAERLEIAQVITAEAGAEPFAGMVAVAQCILQACEDDGLRPSEVLAKYSYSSRRPEPTGEALEAVEAVFDFGIVATSEPIKYFYAPALTESEWHESQVYVMTINNHRFFKEADNDAGGGGS